MREAELEIRVLQAVEDIRAGHRVEDDSIECKRSWPGIDKVRQFAGLCNRARGSEVVLIVGIDESSGKVLPLGDVEVGDWWASFESRFDEVPPDLTNNIRVAVGEQEHVVALAFGTSRIPYVLKADPSSPFDRDVPMRTATGTRSATRRQLLQLLAPTINVPRVTLLDAEVTIEWSDRRDVAGLPEHLAREQMSLRGYARLYIEHLGRDLVMLPTHKMMATVLIGDVPTSCTPSIHASDKPAQRFGVDHRRAGLLVTGPGTAGFYFDSKDMDPRARDIFDAAQSCRVSLQLGVDGGTAPIRLAASLSREPSQSDREPVSWAHGKLMQFGLRDLDDDDGQVTPLDAS